MRTWIYTYKTSDGLRHEGEMFASSKDEVFSELRRHGIRAIRVNERIAPVVRRGFRGLRRREWVCLMALFLFGVIISVWCVSARRHGDVAVEASPEFREVAETHPILRQLRFGVDRLLCEFRKNYECIDLELLANYALVAKMDDTTVFRAEIAKGHGLVQLYRDRVKEQVRSSYQKLPVDDSDARSSVREFYGEVMQDFDLVDEQLLCDECALDMLDSNRGKWHVTRGTVCWTDPSLSRQFEVFERENVKRTTRWRRDFGTVESEVNVVPRSCAK